MTMADLIDQELDPLDGLTQFRNIGTARGEGFSGEIICRLRSRFRGYANYSLQMIRTAEGQQLTNSPLHLAKAGFSVRCGRHFQIAPELQHRAKTLNVQGGFTPAFWLVNANLSFDPQMHGQLDWLNQFRLDLRVRNLLNADYGFPGGFEHRQATIQQDGRNIELNLTVDLF
jgi:outer membrane receptor protein involved in Fe transport